jgi:pyridoxal phosphate enzyme (YggS family)
MGFIEGYNAVRAEIERAAGAAGRDPAGVSVVAVSKTFPADIVQRAIDEGIRLFGENRVQEARDKIPLLKGDFSFHLVGHLQSNKARDAVRLFDLIHSIDKIGTAAAVDREAAKAGKTQDVLVQVNTSGEETKSGIDPPGALALCRDILILQNTRLCGLMTIGPFTEDNGKIRESFRLLRALRDDIAGRLGYPLRELSMGMSFDYAIAVEEGATIVRVGTLIFGTRSEGDEPAQ